jgi:hypothetical protein
MSENCLKLLQAQANKAQVEPMVANRQDRLQRYKDKVSEYTDVSRKVRDDARTLQAEYVEEQNELKDKHNKNFVDEFEEVGTAQMAPLSGSRLIVFVPRLV